MASPRITGPGEAGALVTFLVSSAAASIIGIGIGIDGGTINSSWPNATQP